MRKTTVGFAVFAALFGSSAFAADMGMPLKAPYSPSPAYNWTGCYIGGNAGAARDDYSASITSLGGAANIIPLNTGAGTAAAYGGQIGCDYQFNTGWVVGLRGMWDGTTAKANLQGAFQVPAAATTALFALNAETRSFGTAVARVGYDLTPSLMFYGVGGVAFAQNKYSQTFLLVGPAAGAPFPLFTGSDAPIGWAGGAGVSWMLNPNWDFWVEFNYLGFGNRTVTTNSALGPIVNTVRQDVETVLVGVDFRFTNWAMAH